MNKYNAVIKIEFEQDEEAENEEEAREQIKQSIADEFGIALIDEEIKLELIE